MKNKVSTWILNDKPKFSILLIILMIFQFLAICYFNFTRSELFLDFDSALALRHSIDIWKNKKIFFENFAYVSSLELDCVSFWAAPLIIFTGNISFSFGIIHALLLIFTIFIIMDIFYTINVDFWCAALSVIFIITPYSLGQLDYFNMLFISAGQYLFRVITLLLLIDLLLKPNYKGKKNKILLFIYAIFLFLTSFSAGNYILLMGIAPLVLNEIINIIKNQKIEYKKPSNILLVASGIISVLAIVIRDYGVGITARSSLNLSSASNFYNNIFNCIVGIYLLCDGVTHNSAIPITSIGGIARIFKFLFVTVCIFIVPILVKKHKMFKKTVLFQMTFVIVAVNLFVLMITNSVYGSPVFEHRYHILWFVPIMLACGLCIYYFSNLNKNLYLNYCIFLFFFAVISLSNLQGFKKINEVSSANFDFSNEVISVADKYDTDTIILFNQNDKSHIIRAIDYNKNAISINEDNIFQAYILDYFFEAADSAVLGESNILVASDEQFESLPFYFKKRYTLVERINDVNCYYTEENPFDMYNGLPIAYDASYNFPYSLGYEYEYARINEDGYLVSNGIEGDILKGAHGVYKTGSYNITIDYEIESFENETAKLNVKTSNTLYEINLDSNQCSATINDVKAYKYSNIEVGIWCDKDTIINVKGIAFEKLK